MFMFLVEFNWLSEKATLTGNLTGATINSVNCPFVWDFEKKRYYSIRYYAILLFYKQEI